jgi:hypothetical protein
MVPPIAARSCDITSHEARPGPPSIDFSAGDVTDGTTNGRHAADDVEVAEGARVIHRPECATPFMGDSHGSPDGTSEGRLTFCSAHPAASRQHIVLDDVAKGCYFVDEEVMEGRERYASDVRHFRYVGNLAAFAPGSPAGQARPQAPRNRTEHSAAVLASPRCSSERRRGRRGSLEAKAGRSDASCCLPGIMHLQAANSARLQACVRRSGRSLKTSQPLAVCRAYRSRSSPGISHAVSKEVLRDHAHAPRKGNLRTMPSESRVCALTSPSCETPRARDCDATGAPTLRTVQCHATRAAYHHLEAEARRVAGPFEGPELVATRKAAGEGPEKSLTVTSTLAQVRPSSPDRIRDVTLRHLCSTHEISPAFSAMTPAFNTTGPSRRARPGAGVTPEASERGDAAVAGDASCARRSAAAALIPPSALAASLQDLSRPPSRSASPPQRVPSIFQFSPPAGLADSGLLSRHGDSVEQIGVRSPSLYVHRDRKSGVGPPVARKPLLVDVAGEACQDEESLSGNAALDLAGAGIAADEACIAPVAAGSKCTDECVESSELCPEKVPSLLLPKGQHGPSQSGARALGADAQCATRRHLTAVEAYARLGISAGAVSTIDWRQSWDAAVWRGACEGYGDGVARGSLWRLRAFRAILDDRC